MCSGAVTLGMPKPPLNTIQPALRSLHVMKSFAGGQWGSGMTGYSSSLLALSLLQPSNSLPL